MVQEQELGPDPRDPAVRRKNVRMAVVVLVVILGVALIPALWRKTQQPAGFHDTHAEAVATERGRAALPAWTPASAGDIHYRHNRSTGYYFVRYTLPEEDLEAATAGMRQLSPDEVGRLEVPVTGWDRWWPVTTRTLRGGQAPYLRVYEVPAGQGGGYAVVDPRTRAVLTWRR